VQWPHAIVTQKRRSGDGRWDTRGWLRLPTSGSPSGSSFVLFASFFLRSSRSFSTFSCRAWRVFSTRNGCRDTGPKGVLEGAEEQRRGGTTGGEAGGGGKRGSGERRAVSEGGRASQEPHSMGPPLPCGTLYAARCIYAYLGLDRGLGRGLHRGLDRGLDWRTLAFSSLAFFTSSVSSGSTRSSSGTSSPWRANGPTPDLPRRGIATGMGIGTGITRGQAVQ